MTSFDEDPIVPPLKDPGLKELFFELSELDAAQCERRLSELASTKPALAQTLRELLDVSEEESDFLETPAKHLFSDLCEEIDSASRQPSTDRQIFQESVGRELQKPVTRDLGPFRLIRLLHAGSEGGLYLAKDRQLDRLVALRLLTRKQLSQRSHRKKIMRSIALAAKISHPNVAMILGVFEFGELTAISREWIQGEDLHKWAEQQTTLRFEEIVEIGTALLAGVREVHEMGLIHGDIKPNNVILRPDSRRPMLVDFGMVTAQSYWTERVEIDSQRGATTKDRAPAGGPLKGQPVHADSSLKGGTPHFMAPELFRGSRATVRSDLFAVGVVLYWLSCKKFPYAGDDLLELVENVSGGVYQPLEHERPDFPEQFCDLIGRLLAPTASRRPASVGEVQEVMKPWSQDVAVRSDASAGRRRWLKELALWGGSIASGVGLVVTSDWMKKRALLAEVPPFLPEKATRYHFAAADEKDGDIQSVSGMKFSDFQTEQWGKIRLAYPAKGNRWGWIQFRPIKLQEAADYALVELTMLEAPEAIDSVECVLYARLSSQTTFQRVQRRKFELYYWDVSDFWELGERLELRLGMRYQGATWPSESLPPIGLRTFRSRWDIDPPLDRDVAGAVVGWKSEGN